jgi:hypothetical protein
MASLKQSNGAVKRQPKVGTPSTGTSTPVAPASTQDEIELAVYGTSKPEKPVYDAEQNKIKAQIDVLQTRLVSYALWFFGRVSPLTCLLF